MMRRFSSLHTDFDDHASAPSDTTCSFDLERADDWGTHNDSWCIGLKAVLVLVIVDGWN